jgi:hypothetical protein
VPCRSAYVELEGEACPAHRRDVGLEDEQRPEPGGDDEPVVEFLAARSAEQGGGQACEDRRDEHDVHQLVVRGGGRKTGPVVRRQ